MPRNADDVADAKAKLVKVAGEFDPLSPIRSHPLAAVGLAAAGGAMLGTNPQSLAQAASFVRSVAGMIQTISAATEEKKQPPANP